MMKKFFTRLFPLAALFAAGILVAQPAANDPKANQNDGQAGEKAEMTKSEKKAMKIKKGQPSYIFDTTAVGSESKAATFVVQNLGQAPLLIDKVESQSEEFKVTQVEKKELAPGEKTKFTVVFAPKEGGERIGLIVVLNNDSDEAEFMFKVQGNADGSGAGNGNNNGNNNGKKGGPEIDVLVGKD